MEPVSIRTLEVSKRFGMTQALSLASLNFEAATMHGVIGPEGAGKTTLMRILLGLLKPQEGQVLYFRAGQPVSFEEIRPELAYMPQQQVFIRIFQSTSIWISSEHCMEFRLWNIGNGERSYFTSLDSKISSIVRQGNSQEECIRSLD
jgi:ABC-type Mn2+/Zn2+ transport system ATPase subunit